MRRVALAFFLLLVILPLVAIFNQPFVKAQTTITTSRTFYTTTNDGYAEAFDYNYTAAHDSLTGYPFPTGNIMLVGRCNDTGLYHITRTYLYFDTSLTPESATLLNYTLSLFIYYEINDTQFNLVLQKGTADVYPHEPPASADYYFNNYNGGESGINSTAITTSAYNNMTGTNSSLINFGGETKLILRNSNDVNSSSPAVNDWEWLQIFTRESGYGPILTVWYEAEVYRYVLHGPYYEDGTIPPGITVNVTLYSDFQTPLTFTLPNGSSTYTIEVEQKPNHFTWNISDIDYNYTRFYWLTTASYEDIYITLPIPNLPRYLFPVTIYDLIGVSNAYLESITYFGGMPHVIERQPFTAGNSIPFFLTFGAHYTFRLTCNRGIKTWENQIPIDESIGIKLALNPDDFPGSTYSMNVTLTVTRLNTTAIGVYYTDNRAETINITVKITHVDTSYTSVTDLEYSTAANSLSYVWNVADATTDYYVNVTSYKNGAFYVWVKPAIHPPSATNPWGGVFSIFGVWPFPAQYFLGIGIILSCIAVFSTLSADAGIIITTLITAVLNVINWVNVSWTLIIVAFSLGVLEAMHRAKKRELFR